MSARDAHEADGEGYFASISDLMVGILFVFLLMLTVFALNLRESEDVSKRLFDEKVVQLEAARLEAEQAKTEAERALATAQQAQREADAAKREASDSRQKLTKAVEALKSEVRSREKARLDLLNTLEISLKDQGVSVIVDPDSGVLRLPESLLFEKGQTTLGGAGGGTAARGALAKLSDSLAAVLPCYAGDPPVALNCAPDKRATLEGVLIEGHADHSGYSENGRKLTQKESDDRNDKLSVDRALTVFREIKLRNSLDRLRNASGFALLAVSAYGDRRPVSDGATAEDFQKNRRIDLRFLLSSRTSDDLKRLIEEIEPAMSQP